MIKLVIVLGSVGAASSAIFARWANAPAPVLALYRMLLSVALLLPVIFRRHWDELKKIGFRQSAWCALSGVFFGLQVLLYFESVRRTSIAEAEILTSTEVFFVIFFEVVFWKIPMSRFQVIGVTAAFLGSVVIAAGGAGEGRFSGDILAIFCAVSCAIFTLLGRKCREFISNIVYTAIVNIFSGLTMLIFTIANGIRLTGWGSVNWLSALGLAVFSTLLGHSIFSWGLKYENASFVSTVKMLGPVFGTIMAFLFLREIPNITTVSGGVIVILGVAMSIRSREGKK
jgi:drug/metabolite transporter (DMT)-like permease